MALPTSGYQQKRTTSRRNDDFPHKRVVNGCCAPAGNRVKLLVLCAVLSFSTNFPIAVVDLTTSSTSPLVHRYYRSLARDANNDPNTTGIDEGYCNSYPNTSHLTFKEHINESYIERGNKIGLSEEQFTWYWSFMLNIWFVGFLLGTFLTPLFCENLGRKKALLFSNCIALVGAALSYVGVVFNVPEVLFASRIIASISSGISMGCLILFLQETTPTALRGVTSFLCESAFILSMGVGIGFGMDQLFGENLPMLTAISILPAIVGIVIVVPLHETPKFLLINDDDRDAAIASLEYYRGISEENEEALKEIELEKALDADHKVTIWEGAIEVLTKPHLRIAFLLGSASLQIIVGIWPIIYLSTDLLDYNFTEGISQIASFAFMIAEFVASLFGLLIIERFGRRTLLIGLGIANVISLCLYILSDLLIPLWAPIKWGQIGALILFGITYGVALGPIAYFITSELVPQRSRSIAQSMVLGFNTLMNFILSTITLPCYTHFGVLSFLPLLVIPSIFCLVFLFFYLPETRGREVHTVVEELIERHDKKRGRNVPHLAFLCNSDKV